MLQLKNNTPFGTAFVLLPNEQGIDTFYIMAKATFNIGPQWTLAAEQSKPQQGDIYWGEPETSSLRIANDFHIGKPNTDIIMMGHACAPQQQAVHQMDVSLSVGHIGKRVRVFGDRVWDRGRISTPQPYITMPIIYERAFGGTEKQGEKIIALDERNPVGLGFSLNPSDTTQEGKPLPNIENPNDLIHYLDDKPAPVGFGPLSPSWPPRATLGGTYDELWQTTRAPFLPDDYQPAFMNTAPPDLIYEGYLEGGEPVKINGMHPRGNLEFVLPKVNLVNKVTIANKVASVPFVLETLLLDPNNLQLSMVWRSAFLCDKRSLKIVSAQVSLAR
jgi:hypothetical protein